MKATKVGIAVKVSGLVKCSGLMSSRFSRVVLSTENIEIIYFNMCPKQN